MNYKTKRRLNLLKNYIIIWLLAFLFLAIIRGSGTIEKGAVQFDFRLSVLVSIVFGIFFGTISGYIQVLTEERIYKRISLKKFILLRFVYALVFLTILILISYAMVTTLFGIEISLLTFTFEPGSFAIYLYILSVDLFTVILRQISLLIGERNLKQLFMGKFYTPREEERIFMFIDLQSSTQLAEKLGHIKYSMLIQDCFNDLGVVIQNEAEIYQYVGDEVILTWKLQNGLKNQNCLKAYFNFAAQLRKKEAYYMQNYNCKPFFKAGVHAGIVTVTEVGKYKKEIAYHGDTLNTTARIQEQCNTYQQALIVSEYLMNRVSLSGFTFQKLHKIALKGKANEMLLFGTTEST